MKLTYLANIRIPTEKAHGLQVMKMCEAFTQNGNTVELVIAKRFNQQFAGVDPFSYYQIKHQFPIRRLWLIDMVETGRSFKGLSVIIQNTSFALAAFFYLLFDRGDVIYSRDQFSLFFLSFFKNNLVWEMHQFPTSNLGLYRWLFRRLKKIVVITNQLKELVVTQGIAPAKVIVASDGVDLNQFNIAETKEQCRKKLSLPLDQQLVIYTGHLWQWKGVYVLAEASKFLPDNFQVIFVGGMEYDRQKLQTFITEKHLPRIRLVDHQPPSAVPYWLKAADCLVLPNSGQQEISRRYTSPLKLFEYMAAQRPIVAAQLPSIQELLDEKTAILVKSDDPGALANGILMALNNKQFSDIMVKQAFAAVKQFTWQKRAERIVSAI